MAKFHHLYHGGGNLGGFVRPMYQQYLASGCCACPPQLDTNVTVDAAWLDSSLQLGLAGHKGYTDAALSRTLDFYGNLVDQSYSFDSNKCLVAGDNNGRIQVALQQYLKCQPIAQDDTIGIAVISPHTLLQGVAVMVEVAEAGIVFDVVEMRSGAVLGTVDCSAVGSQWFKVDEWEQGQRMVALVAKSFPAAGAKSLRITTSPVIIEAWNGN